MKDKPLYFLRRVIKQDGTVETYSPWSAEPVKIEKKPLEEPCPEPPPKPVYKQLTCKRCGQKEGQWCSYEVASEDLPSY
jgi:hypothetical protein